MIKINNFFYFLLIVYPFIYLGDFHFINSDSYLPHSIEAIKPFLHYPIERNGGIYFFSGYFPHYFLQKIYELFTNNYKFFSIFFVIFFRLFELFFLIKLIKLFTTNNKIIFICICFAFFLYQ